MAVVAVPFFPSTILKLAPKLSSFIFDIHVSPAFSSFSLAFSATNCNNFTNRFTFRLTNPRKLRRNPRPPSAAMIFPQNPVISDICATLFSGSVALSVLRVWEETAKRRLFDQKLNRKLVHISIGLVFMLCWPLFSSGYRGAILAAITPGVNIIRMLLIGSGIWKDEATVKSMSRYGDYRELLKGPLYYATTITLACAVYWRTSPIAIAAICNLCAGDGLADVVGRRFGRQKLPYNRNKSIAGSVAMATAGFLTSVGYMYYFSYFGYIQESWEIVLGFLVVSLASALVESLPISTELDDNLTVTLTSILVGTLVF
ncbi:probable phytol kinase 3, chloroplastic isoform X1 [Durio zibethinus]|uniref:Probable phytol kinase 3, chloroplastic isoform X1 n=1 Tax=Durio zibethinus TaxID=66656 RepID=A0A6P5XUN0_DURZI|nr:probable phytol kinase 3, chloroplastic isoform X1 [Durio zibethinus]